MNHFRIILIIIFSLNYFIGFTQEEQTIYSNFINQYKWILGKWEGIGYKEPFYEEYTIVNDTLIRVNYFESDSTFYELKNTGIVYYSKGKVFHKYGESSIWIASIEEPNKLHFKGFANATNSFIWKREDENNWIVLMNNDTYKMKNVKIKKQ